VSAHAMPPRSALRQAETETVLLAECRSFPSNAITSRMTQGAEPSRRSVLLEEQWRRRDRRSA